MYGYRAPAVSDAILNGGNSERARAAALTLSCNWQKHDWQGYQILAQGIHTTKAHSP